MEAVVREGGDVVDVLDWLCLNLKNGLLSDVFFSNDHVLNNSIFIDFLF